MVVSFVQVEVTFAVAQAGEVTVSVAQAGAGVVDEE